MSGRNDQPAHTVGSGSNAPGGGTDAGSIAADPAFAAPLAGDYTATGTAAASTGFADVPMSDYGVRPARLKALACTPSFAAPAQPGASALSGRVHAGGYGATTGTDGIAGTARTSITVSAGFSPADVARKTRLPAPARRLCRITWASPL